MEWQPIETAPIGQYVLIAFYWKKYKEFYEDGQPWDIGCGTYTGGRYVDQLHLDLNDMDAVWMPLPKPPQELNVMEWQPIETAPKDGVENTQFELPLETSDAPQL